MSKRTIQALTILFCALTIASEGQSADAISSNAATEQFQTVKKHPSNLIRVNADADWGSYGTYRLIPAVYEPSGTRSTVKPALRPEEIRKVTAVVDRSLQRAFAGTGAGEGAVLEVRPVVMSFKRTNTALNLISFAAIQAPVSFGGAAVRYELVDGESGEEIGEISCARNARPWNVYPWNALKNFEGLGQGSVILKSDAGRLRKDVEFLRRFRAKPGQKTLPSAE